MVMKAKACRCLFGSPNHDQIEQELKSKLEEMNIAESEKWNFDFGTDSPMRGRYNWEALQSDEVAYVPSFYTTDRSAECSAKRKSRKTLKRPAESVVGLSYVRLAEAETPASTDNRLKVAKISETETATTTVTVPNRVSSTIVSGARVEPPRVRVPIPERGLHTKVKRKKMGRCKSYIMKPSTKKTLQTTLPSLFRVIKNSGAKVTSSSVKSTLSSLR